MGNLKNRVILTGRLGAQPVLTTLDSGSKVCNFTLATNESFVDAKNEKQIITDWHNLSAWKGKADLMVKYVNKGDKISIEGRLKTRKSVDANGTTHYNTYVLVDEIEFHMVIKSEDTSK